MSIALAAPADGEISDAVEILHRLLQPGAIDSAPSSAPSSASNSTPSYSSSRDIVDIAAAQPIPLAGEAMKNDADVGGRDPVLQDGTVLEVEGAGTGLHRAEGDPGTGA